MVTNREIRERPITTSSVIRGKSKRQEVMLVVFMIMTRLVGIGNHQGTRLYPLSRVMKIIIMKL